MTTLFRSLLEREKKHAVESLISESTPRDDFFFMIVLAVVMATFGLIVNNASIIIGSMLIAPLLSPILGIGMGIVMADRKLIMRSFITVLKSVAFAVPTAAIITLFFGGLGGLGDGLNVEIQTRLQPDILSAAIALVSGLAASYALIKPQLNAALPGVAVAASLVPPLAVTGIGVARMDWSIISESFVLFSINAALIVFSSTVIFSLMRLYSKQVVAEEAMKKEDGKMRKEVARAKVQERK